MTAARTLLLETNQSVEKIALAVGYQSLNHFFRQFCEYYGNTHQSWRKKYGINTRSLRSTKKLELAKELVR
ncbi:helix-turn-helix domain-containing protein [Nostoc sp. UHCC 0870]|uniref:helix-turn-helix domain-containing protein n=1 Tax=Nostoc sp. UHCC 0870 TaxID=2914041 RepID=UPI001EE0C50B|nr:AraC family transcriptional regulator [Nostoc sp. UHCC 0870]UKO95917.1 AraC family transcriptional regulator [Nostoc sp. UHCC 0870]